MCGIAGVVWDAPRGEVADGAAEGAENGAEIARIVRSMCEAERRRGPDGLEIWTNGRVGLGMVRLAVVGSADRGRQPISDDRGRRLIFNGELYDPGRVMASLGGSFECDDCDGVALLRLLARRGPGGLQGVSAMFSLALYDPETDEVLLARDAWGQKPLYLRRIEGGLAFASTVAALRAASGPLRIRAPAIHECLIFKSVGGNGSAFEGVEQLPAGGWLRIGRGGVRTSGRWFEVPDPDDRTAVSSDEIHDRLVHAIEARCSDRYRNAVFLSGGLDSSIVATIAARPGGRPRALPGALAGALPGALSPHVFTVGYDVGGWQDEHGLAVRLADELGLEHRTLVVESAQVPDLLRDTAVALEDPVHDPVVVPTLALARLAAVETKVVLTGDGSDEFWAGYARFDDPTDDIDAYLARTMVFRPHELGLDGIPASYLDGAAVPAAGAMPALDRILRLEAGNRLRNYHLARVDKLTMSTGLEARSPFLDARVTRLAASMPAACKRAGGRPKGALIDAFARDLPAWLLARRKQPFTVPVETWLAGPLRDFCNDTLGAPGAFVRAFTDPAAWLAAFAAKPADGGLAMRVWSLLHLEIWYRAFGREMEASA